MKTIQYLGPFITNSGIAKVNRGLGIALSKIQDEYAVTFDQSANTVDREVVEADKEKFPFITKLLSKAPNEPDVVIYNNYPKGGHVLHGFKDFPGKLKIMYIAWEESVYPEMWVKEINENLHGVIVAASFVKDILRKSGVKVPIEIVPNALDDFHFKPSTSEYKLNTNKKFKFLHISTGRKRKGVDVLIKAYFQSFTKEDDVCLLIKSYPSPDNQVSDIIQELRNDNSPEILHINNPDLTEEEVISLVKQSDVCVYPTRTEGFGLTIAEAMFHKKPLIVTGYGAQMDFVDEDNSFVINYKLENTTDSEMVNLGAKWAEPDVEDLSSQMKEVLQIISNDNKDEILNSKFQILNSKVENAYESVKDLTWENSAKKTYEFIKRIEKVASLKNKKVAVMSFLNNQDGIAEYTKDLFSRIENSFGEFYYLSNTDISDRTETDHSNVIRNWESGETDFTNVISFLKEKGIDIFHIQYHSGINFPTEALSNLIQAITKLKVKVYVTLHAVKGNGFDLIKDVENLKFADKVFIHNKSDYEYAKQTMDNAIYFALPKHTFPHRLKSRLKKELLLDQYFPIIATHGYMNSSKTRIPDVIKAIGELKKTYPNILYIAVNAVSSNNISSAGELEVCRNLVEDLGLERNVVFVSDFLEENQIQLF